MMPPPHDTRLSPELLQQIGEAIAGVRFGYVHLTIHDARIVQIERAEKTRVQSSAYLTTGGAHAPVSRDDRTSGSPRLVPGR